MQLIALTDKKDRWGKRIGIFLCPFCGKRVELMLSHGREYHSCGCKKHAPKHGMARTKLYHVWQGMKARCDNPSHGSFAYYGGRGISVYEAWLDPDVFMEWARRAGYREGLEIDRKDNDGNYEPGNCIFTTHVLNSQHRRSSKLVPADIVSIRAEFPRARLTYGQFGNIYGVSGKCIENIIKGRRWANVEAPQSRFIGEAMGTITAAEFKAAVEELMKTAIVIKEAL